VRAASDSTGPSQNAPSRLFLLYHEIRSGGSEYSYVTDAAMFERHANLYAQLRKRDGSGLRPELTFDDGHVSNLQIAAPILQSHGLTARFFITAGWTGKRPGYMGWDELRALQAAGHQIGGHGWAHKLLTHCSDGELQSELSNSRLTLEDKLSTSITTMSLPGGRRNARVLAACRQAGYTHVFTSVPQAESVPLGTIVGRLNIRGDMQPDWIAKLFRPQSGLLRSIERQHRIKETVKAVLGDQLYAKLWALKNRQEPEAEDHWESAE
jgi:peptidoglycan/xylan/chitin deacetylase (PgdA/CDA1 family)